MSRKQVKAGRVEPIVLQPVGSRIWDAFERELTQSISDLAEDEYLVVTSKRGNRFVQFAGEGAHGMRIEAVSNAYLGENEQLTSGACRRLAALGWQPPTHDPDVERKNPAEGSPNFFLDVAAPVPHARIAAIAVATLRDVYRLGHVGRLEYLAFSTNGGAIRFPGLRIKRAAPPAVKPARSERQRAVAPAECEAGEWTAMQLPDEPFARVCDHENRVVAFVEGTEFGEAFGRAVLVAKAPALREAALGALQAVRAIYANEDGPAGQVAGSVIALLELALHGTAGVPPTDSAVM